MGEQQKSNPFTKLQEILGVYFENKVFAKVFDNIHSLKFNAKDIINLIENIIHSLLQRKWSIIKAFNLFFNLILLNDFTEQKFIREVKK